MTARSVLVVAGAPRVTGLAVSVAAADVVIAADGGLDHLAAFGHRPDLVIGDLDSVSAAALDAAIADGIEVERHRPDKDETDLELALAAAVARGATEIVVTGLDGGRADHWLAGLLILGSQRWASVAVTALLEGATVTVVHGERLVTGAPGDLVTLLAIGGPAEGVSTEGLRYRLVDARLTPGSGQGVSNVLDVVQARIRVVDGVLFAVHVGPD